MVNYSSNKYIQIKKMFFALRVLALLFSAVAFSQYFDKQFEIFAYDIYNQLITLGSVMVIVCIALLLWITLTTKGKFFRILELVVFFVIFMTLIYHSGAEESNYKYLFLFIIVSYTIEYGMKTGMMISIISSGLVLGIDLVFGGFKAVNVYFQNDLALAAMFIIISWTLGFYVKTESAHIDKLTEYANLDGMTGLYNHRYFHQFLKEIYEKSFAENRALSLIFFDLDYFKSYNDIYGHQKGDELLKAVAGLTKRNIRSSDVLFRYGGDEFCVVLPDTSKETAGEVAHRLREVISGHHFEEYKCARNGNLTISVGVSALDSAVHSYMKLIDNADSALYRAKFLRRNRVEVYSSVFEQFGELEQNKAAEESLRSLKALITVINSRDTYTYMHSERVVDYCRLMADYLDLNMEQKKCLVYSAYLHDLGKINISKEILISDKKLTNEEWGELKRHPVDSADIIGQIESFRDMADVVLQHHEKYDGSGYPNGLKGEEITYLARILTIVDSFDAMTNHRPYQSVKTFDEAFEEIANCKGSHFDPVLAEQFIDMMKSQ